MQHYEDNWEWDSNNLFKNGKRVANLEYQFPNWNVFVNGSNIGKHKYHSDAKKIIKNKLAEHSAKLGVMLNSVMYLS